jgi:tellurite resistance protein TerC
LTFIDDPRVPQKFQHKVLFWGIIGANVFRGVFIFLGVAALERWDWISYVFGAILLCAAVQAFRKDAAAEEESKTVKLLSRYFPIKQEPQGGHFMVHDNRGWAATPLLVALVSIEITDVLFAIDSVPAALSVTRDRFLVYSANIFAILRLRALYLYLISSITQLRYLHYGLAAVLAFAALKIISDEWLPISPLLSIAIVVAVIGISVGWSKRTPSSKQFSELHRLTAHLAESKQRRHV